MMASPLLRILLLLVCLVGIQGKAFIRLCYFPNWAYQRPSVYTRFDVENVDPSLCTHLVYAFALVDVDSHKIVAQEPNVEETTGLGTIGRYQKFNNLKNNHPHLKTLLSVGGEYAGSDAFLSITKNSLVLDRFATTTVDFLRKRGFDGLDIDWEFPNATTKNDFSKLIKTLRTAFEEEKTSKQRLILTAALPPGRHIIDYGYDMGALRNYLDLANLMTYDYHGGWSDVTGFDSPLFSRISDHKFSAELSTNWTVNYYISRGLPAEKILVGVTAAGTRFKLKSTNNTGVGAPIIKPDPNNPRKSDLWQLVNRYAYPELCRVLQSTLAQRVFDEEQKVPFVYKETDWFGYEDVASLKNKVIWMMKMGVAGAMFWALDMDDFTGRVCDEGKYPLLKALGHAVSRVEDSHLTDHVNPNIRYLTKYTGDGTLARPCSWVVILAAVVVTILWN